MKESETTIQLTTLDTPIDSLSAFRRTICNHAIRPPRMNPTPSKPQRATEPPRSAAWSAGTGTQEGPGNKMPTERSVRSPTGLPLLLFVLLIHSSFANDFFEWDQAKQQVRADVHEANLEELLAKISTASGWHVYMEPDSTRKVSVKFKDLPPPEALKRLLGDLNFALIPQSPSRLLIYRTSLQRATRRIEGARAKRSPRTGAVPDELIVTLKADSAKTIEDLAKQLGARIIGRADDLNTYRLQFETAEAATRARKQLAEDETLGAVDSNYYLNNPRVNDPQRQAVTQPFSLKPNGESNSGKVVVGLIDTPVQALPPEMTEFLLDPIHVAGAPGALDGELTHGTSMAETILRGIEFVPQSDDTSNIRILPVDVYGPNPETTTFDVARGIYAAVNSGATVINLSMGGDADSPFLADVIQQANRAGVLFFGAAGNEPDPLPNFPAAYPSVIAVTAGNHRGEIAPYANYGSFVDVVAPGVSYVNFRGDSYVVTGTSSSTAYVSGTAAGLLESGKSAAETAGLILQSFAPKSAP